MSYKINWLLLALGVTALPALAASIYFNTSLGAAASAFLVGYVVREIIDWMD